MKGKFQQHRRIAMEWILSLFMISVFFHQGYATVLSECPPCNGYICECVSVIHNRTVSSEAVVQRCDVPVGVTFTVEVASFNIYLQHTFSNEDETVEVEGWNGFRLHVKLIEVGPAKLRVEAIFKIYDKEQAIIIDDVFEINRHDCSVVRFESTDGMSDGGKIAIAVVVLVLVVAVIVALVILYQRNYICAKKPPLVEMMENPANTEPYQEGPSESSLRVEYRVNKASVKSEGKDEIITNLNAQSTEKLDVQSSDASISRPRPKASKTRGSVPGVAILEPTASPSKTTGAIPKVRSAQAPANS